MRILPLLAVLALVGCDSNDLEGGDPFEYATAGTDSPVDVAQAANGDLLVSGSTEGVQRPADGTLALPTVLRFGLDGEVRSAEVYRDLGFGSAQGLAFVDGGLLVAVAAGPDEPGESVVTLFRTDETGRRRETVFRPDAGYMPPRTIRALEDGSVVMATFGQTSDSPHLYRVSPSGTVLWATRLDGAQDVRAIEPAPGGDLYVIASGRRSVVARLNGADGSERWRSTRENGSSFLLTRTTSGLALFESSANGSVLEVVQLGADGTELSTTTVLEVESDGDEVPSRGVSPSALEALPDGRFAVAWTELDRNVFGSASAIVAVVGLEVERTARFGERGRWARVTAFESLADGRVAAVGETGPETLGGYGGDDLDIHVTLYDVD